MYFPAIWEHSVSWKHSRKCVSMALERLLECHDLGLKVTTFTICLLKIPGYMATAQQKNPNLVVRRINRLIMHSAFILVWKEWSPPFLIHSVSLSARAHTERLSAWPDRWSAWEKPHTNRSPTANWLIAIWSNSLTHMSAQLHKCWC